MGDALKKVTTGSPLAIPAAAYNAFIDAARAEQAHQGDQGVPGQAAPRESGIVLIKNTTESDLDRFAILGIDSPVFTPTDNEQEFKNRVALKGVAPTLADHEGRFAILLEPVKAGGIAMACVQGVFPVKVDVQDEDHDFADVDDGECGHLKSALTGAAQILWKESGTGEKWAVVRIGPPHRAGFWARLTAEAAGGGGYYSWKMLEDDAETDVDPSVTGTDNAKEVNGTEGIPTGAGAGAVVWMELDRTDDPREYRFAYDPGGGGGPAVVRIVSYSGGVYTVQPVVRSGGAWQDAGAPLTNIRNFGEVQAEEAGYLAGPSGCDIYVPLFEAGDERFLLVHPPRMV